MENWINSMATSMGLSAPFATATAAAPAQASATSSTSSGQSSYLPLIAVAVVAWLFL